MNYKKCSFLCRSNIKVLLYLSRSQLCTMCSLFINRNLSTIHHINYRSLRINWNSNLKNNSHKIKHYSKISNYLYKQYRHQYLLYRSHFYRGYILKIHKFNNNYCITCIILCSNCNKGFHCIPGRRMMLSKSCNFPCTFGIIPVHLQSNHHCIKSSWLYLLEMHSSEDNLHKKLEFVLRRASINNRFHSINTRFHSNINHSYLDRKCIANFLKNILVGIH